MALGITFQLMSLRRDSANLAIPHGESGQGSP
jgi:hypothetical protein